MNEKLKQKAVFVCPFCYARNKFEWLEDTTLRCENCDELFDAEECEEK